VSRRCGTTADEAKFTYEQLVERLEAITRQMAAGDIGIEEAADLYEEAGRLHALAAERLAKVQERIDAIGDDAADGPVSAS
jgi:exodeoxyribonuclease VII small subunit